MTLLRDSVTVNPPIRVKTVRQQISPVLRLAKMEIAILKLASVSVLAGFMVHRVSTSTALRNVNNTARAIQQPAFAAVPKTGQALLAWKPTINAQIIVRGCMGIVIPPPVYVLVSLRGFFQIVYLLPAPSTVRTRTAFAT